MIKKALEYFASFVPANITDIHGHTYSDKPLNRISYNPKAEPIKMNTLTSLVDYIKAEHCDVAQTMFIHIVSPTKVRFFSALDNERKRECLVEVDALVPSFKFETFINHEAFCIGLQSKFLSDPDTHKELLLKFAGTVESGSIAEYGDDGVTQKATVKKGIASKTEAIVPSPALLKPYRTFAEIDQPESNFIFRMKEDKYEGICCALYEADGGAWKMEAVKRIKAYLEESLEDTGISVFA